MSLAIFAVGFGITILVAAGIYLSVREVRALINEAEDPSASSSPETFDHSPGNILSFRQPPRVGLAAPSFELRDQDGRLRSMEQYSGRPTAVVFYGTDFTPGSMKLALDLRDLGPVFRSAGVDLVAIGSSSWRRHQAFSRQHVLDFDLLSDPGRCVAGLYGAARDGELFAWLFGRVRPMAVLLSADGRVVETIADVGLGRLAESVAMAVSSRFLLESVSARLG